MFISDLTRDGFIDLGVEASYAIKHVDDDRGFRTGYTMRITDSCGIIKATHGKRQSNKG
jgi:hypothetical protein